MAYIAFDEMGSACLPASVAPRVVDSPPFGESDLTGVEWSVVALARFDRLSSLRRPGRVATVLGALFGRGGDASLAHRRLEALRRVAVLGWHHGYAIPTSELRAFLGFGFTAGQYETMQKRIGADRLKRSYRL